MKVGYGILSVEAPDGSHRCPCERRQPIEADIRPVQAVWYKAWPGSQRLFLSPRMAQTQDVLTRAAPPSQLDIINLITFPPMLLQRMGFGMRHHFIHRFMQVDHEGFKHRHRFDVRCDLVKGSDEVPELRVSIIWKVRSPLQLSPKRSCVYARENAHAARQYRLGAGRNRGQCRAHVSPMRSRTGDRAQFYRYPSMLGILKRRSSGNTGVRLT